LIGEIFLIQKSQLKELIMIQSRKTTMSNRHYELAGI
jgi:hypothetical protein